MKRQEFRDLSARSTKRKLLSAAKRLIAYVSGRTHRADDYDLSLVRRRLLLATRPDQRATLSPYFDLRMRARLRKIPRQPKLTFWETVGIFSKSFVLVWSALLLLMIGISVYIRGHIQGKRHDLVTSLAERNFSESEQTILSEDEEITSENVLSVLMSEGDNK